MTLLLLGFLIGLVVTISIITHKRDLLWKKLISKLKTIKTLDDITKFENEVEKLSKFKTFKMGETGYVNKSKIILESKKEVLLNLYIEDPKYFLIERGKYINNKN